MPNQAVPCDRSNQLNYPCPLGAEFRLTVAHDGDPDMIVTLCRGHAWDLFGEILDKTRDTAEVFGIVIRPL